MSTSQLAILLSMSVLVYLLFIVLWLTGVFRWLWMAACFLAGEASQERRELLFVRWKLRVLKGLAGQIGQAEAQVAELERGDDG